LFPNPDPQLEITSPLNGTLVSGHDPVQLFVELRDANFDSMRLSVDGVVVPNLVTNPPANGQYCDFCEIRVTWGGLEAKDGLHVIGIDAFSGNDIAKGAVDMIFEDMPEIASINLDHDADLAGFGLVKVEVGVIERGRATLKIDIDGVETATRDSAECNRADGCPLTFMWDTTALPAGNHELHFTITDDKGNTVEDSRTVSLDDVIQVTSLGVNGIVDEDTATLEMEVYAFDADTNAFLGCAGSKHGLATVDTSGQTYEVDAVLVKAGSDPLVPRFLRGSDLATRNIRFEVWEDDDAPTCPSALEPLGNDLAGVSTARSYETWKDTTAPQVFGNVSNLTVKVGRPRQFL
jgi:hypothetical protein